MVGKLTAYLARVLACEIDSQFKYEAWSYRVLPFLNFEVCQHLRKRQHERKLGKRIQRVVMDERIAREKIRDGTKS